MPPPTTTSKRSRNNASGNDSKAINTSHLTSLHSLYKSSLNLTPQEISHLLQFQVKNLDILKVKSRQMADRVLRFQRRQAQWEKKLLSLQKKDLKRIEKQLQEHHKSLHSKTEQEANLKVKIRELQIQRDQESIQQATLKSESDAREEYLSDAHHWTNEKFQTLQTLQDSIADKNTIMPSIRTEIFQHTNQIEHNDKETTENLKQLRNLLAEENQLALKRFEHQNRLTQHKNQFEKLKVQLSQIGLLLRLNQSSKNDYKRKMAEMEMKRDDIGLDVEKAEEEIAKLSSTLKENQEKLHEVNLKLNDQEAELYKRNKEAFTVKEQLSQKKNVLLSQHTKVKSMIGTLTMLKKHREAAEQESERLSVLVKSIQEDKESQQKDIQEKYEEIEESTKTLKEEEEKKDEMRTQLTKLLDELKQLEVEMQDTRKTMETWKQKGKKSKQAHNQAKRNLQVATRKFRVAQKNSENHRKILNKEKAEHQEHTSKLETTSKSDRRAILEIRAALGSLEFRIEQAETEMERLEEEERKRSNDHIIATMEEQKRDKEKEEVEARVDEAVANNALLVKKQTELKNQIEEQKSTLNEQLKVVEDLKKRSTGQITISKVDQLNISLRDIESRAAASNIKVEFIQLRKQQLDESIEYWSDHLKQMEEKAAVTQKEVDGLKEEQKKAIRLAAEQKSLLEATEKNEHRKQLQLTQSSEKQLGLTRGRLEGLLIARERFATLCTYFPWADESESSKDKEHNLDDLRKEYSKVENDIEEEKQHIATYKDVLRRGRMENDQVKRKQKQLQSSSVSDADQKKKIQQEHRLSILEEELEGQKDELELNKKQTNEIHKAMDACRKKSRSVSKTLTLVEQKMDDLSNKILHLEGDLQNTQREIGTLSREIRSMRDKREQLQKMEHRYQQKLASLNAELRLAEEERADSESKLKEIDEAKQS